MRLQVCLRSSNHKCWRGLSRTHFFKEQKYWFRVLLFSFQCVLSSNDKYNKDGNHDLGPKNRKNSRSMEAAVGCFNVELHLIFMSCNPGKFTSSSKFLYITHNFHYIWFLLKTDSLTSSSPAYLFYTWLPIWCWVAAMVINILDGVIISSLSTMEVLSVFL